MKVTTNPPVPVEPTVVVEMTQHEALIVKRVMSRVLVSAPEGNVTYELYSSLVKVVTEYPTVAKLCAADPVKWPGGYLTFNREEDA